MGTKIVAKIKEEIERLLREGFIRTAKYVEWLVNIVPVIKKNNKLRIGINFRDLNHATSKDEYPTPIVDMVIDVTSTHGILSFMYGYSGYNLIFIAENNVPKMAFQCPGTIGTLSSGYHVVWT